MKRYNEINEGTYTVEQRYKSLLDKLMDLSDELLRLKRLVIHKYKDKRTTDKDLAVRGTYRKAIAYLNARVSEMEYSVKNWDK